MQFIHDILQFLAPIFWALMRNSLYATILFILIWCLLRIWKNASPAWRLGLYSLVGIRLLLPPDLAFLFSGRNILVNYVFNNSLLLSLTGFLSQSWHEGRSFDAQAGANLSLLPTRSVPLNAVPMAYDSWWLHLLIFIWLLAVLFLVSYYLKKVFSYHRLIRHATPSDRPDLAKLVEKWRSLFQVKRPVRLVSSDSYPEPFTIGIWRPRIYLPKIVLEKGDDTLTESIIAHEMAHIKRLDDLQLKIFALVKIVYFFHPVVWWLQRSIALERECRCDQMVLARRQLGPDVYGHGLLTMVKLNQLNALTPELLSGFSRHYQQLKYRLQKLNGGIPMKTHNKWFHSIFLLLAGCWVLPMAQTESAGGKWIIFTSPVLKAQTKSVPVTATGVNDRQKIAFDLPIHTGRLTAGFGKMKHPFKDEIVFHRGVDIAASKGTEIYAAADGQVLVAESVYEANQGSGKHLVLQHADGYQTQYTHLDEILVQKDELVKAGTVIARVGSTGLSSGPHLHFEILLDGQPQNPADFLDFKNLKAR